MTDKERADRYEAALRKIREHQDGMRTPTGWILNGAAKVIEIVDEALGEKTLQKCK